MVPQHVLARPAGVAVAVAVVPAQLVEMGLVTVRKVQAKYLVMVVLDRRAILPGLRLPMRVVAVVADTALVLLLKVAQAVAEMVVPARVQV